MAGEQQQERAEARSAPVCSGYVQLQLDSAVSECPTAASVRQASKAANALTVEVFPLSVLVSKPEGQFPNCSLLQCVAVHTCNHAGPLRSSLSPEPGMALLPAHPPDVTCAHNITCYICIFCLLRCLRDKAQQLPLRSQGCACQSLCSRLHRHDSRSLLHCGNASPIGVDDQPCAVEPMAWWRF